MRKGPLIAIAAVVTGLVVGIALANSGGDDGSATSVTTPELTVPGGSGQLSEGEGGGRGTTGDSGQSEPDQQQEQQEQQTSPSEPTGGSPAPSQDTEQNDVPPPPGSPADRFERFCEQNPGAC